MMRASTAIVTSLTAFLSSLGLLVVAGCASATPTPTPTATPTPTPRPTPTPSTTDVRTIEFAASDGVTLSGRVFGNGDQWVVLAHMYPADQNSWQSFAQELASHGYRAFTFNFRGYPPSGGTKDIPRFNLDVQAALKYARDAGASKVFLVGASVGGTAVLKVAAEDEVPGVIALSAPQRFQGLELTLANILNIKSPTLLLASQDDRSAADDARNTFDSIRSAKEITVYPGGAHGTNMLIGVYGQDTRDRILNFIEKYGQ